MIYTRPYFFNDFKCKAEKCTDTCCAGWEVDIDDVSIGKYRAVTGEYANRLMSGIEDSKEQPFFKLQNNNRCTFLAENGLCDIYLHLGSEYLCDICREHPRFYDFFDGITEMGLGLCCEKVCEMIFKSDNAVTFESFSDENNDETDEDDRLYFLVRDKIFDIVYDRSAPLKNRVFKLMEYAVTIQNELFFDDFSFSVNKELKSVFHSVVKLYSETEAISDEWTDCILAIQNDFDRIFLQLDIIGLKEYEYEQILTYILYRHFMQSRFSGSILAAVSFAVVSLTFICILDCKTFCDKHCFDLSDRINNVKLWSKQIEYSAENTELILKKAIDILF